jgi:hypothetical protein
MTSTIFPRICGSAAEKLKETTKHTRGPDFTSHCAVRVLARRSRLTSAAKP